MAVYQFLLKQSNNWSLIRILRLLMASVILIQAAQTMDLILGLLGGFILYQVVMNVGCCGVSGCAVPSKTEGENLTQDIEFVEVKPKQD
jgi:hypothetical protein